MTSTITRSMREAFVDEVATGLESDPRLALVLADISAGYFEQIAERRPEQVLNVGIREQAMVGVAGGMALTGMRPVVHSITPFLVERPYEQIKLDLNHQDVGGVLVSTGASYDVAFAGRTHMAPADVALLDALPGWTVHVPGHPDEFAEQLRSALPGDDRAYLRMSEQVNDEAFPGDRIHVIRQGRRGVVLAVGPMLRPVLSATAHRDVNVLYAPTVRPFDGATLRRAALAAEPEVVLVEPYLAGTSTHLVNDALSDVPHRVRALGVPRESELRAYGTPEEHAAAYGLDPIGIAAALEDFLGQAPVFR